MPEEMGACRATRPRPALLLCRFQDAQPQHNPPQGRNSPDPATPLALDGSVRCGSDAWERYRNMNGADAPLIRGTDEDLGLGDFVKVDCAACHHVALLTPQALLRVGICFAKSPGPALKSILPGILKQSCVCPRPPRRACKTRPEAPLEGDRPRGRALCRA